VDLALFPESGALAVGRLPPRLYISAGATVIDEDAAGGGGATPEMPGPAAGEEEPRLLVVLEQPANPKTHTEITKDLDNDMREKLS
jgi:hypothetical protein